MAIKVNHKFTSAVADSADANIVQPSDWNEAHNILITGPAVIGKLTAGEGAAVEVPVNDLVGGKVTKADDTGLGGFAVSGKSLGNLSGSLTPTYIGGNYQAGTITGALAINAPTAPGVYDLKIELLIGAGAGAVTLSGFDNTDFGEAFTTASGDFFILQIEKGTSQTIATVRKPE